MFLFNQFVMASLIIKHLDAKMRLAIWILKVSLAECSKPNKEIIKAMQELIELEEKAKGTSVESNERTAFTEAKNAFEILLTRFKKKPLTNDEVKTLGRAQNEAWAIERKAYRLAYEERCALV